MPWVLSIVLMVASVALLWRFAWTPERGFESKWVLWLAIVAIVVASGTMGFVRSQARGSDMMFRVMDEEGELQEAPEVYLTPPISGQAIFGTNCSACHPGLAGDAPSKARERHPDADELKVFLRDPAAIGIAMPAFSGTDDELDALVEYLLGE
jgi:mono/diheme cytochrome c family protein